MMRKLHQFHPARVAEKLGISRSTIDRLCRRGELRKVIVSPRRVYVDPQSLKKRLGDDLFAELFESAE